ncbi:MAG: hypothetical protein ACOYKA_04365 [Legionellaceae bacterium]
MESRIGLHERLSDAVHEYQESFIDTILQAHLEHGEERVPDENMVRDAKISGQCLYELMEAITQCDDEVLLLSIGSCVSLDMDSDTPLDQQIPPYILNYANDHTTQIMLLDMQFNAIGSAHGIAFSPHQDLSNQAFLNTDRAIFEKIPCQKQSSSFKSTSHPKLELSTFGPLLLSLEKTPTSWAIIQEGLESILERGGKLFIASHLDMYDLDFVPAMIPLYNDLKTKYGASVQLYIQGSMGPVFRYGEHVYVEKDIEAILDDNEMFKPEDLSNYYQDFDVCPSIKDLSHYRDFQTTSFRSQTKAYKDSVAAINRSVEENEHKGPNLS